jgi:RNase P/RNase MRP subunit p30
MQYLDVVFPEDNEDAFVDRARLLGISELCFVYPQDVDLVRVKKKLQDIPFPCRIGLLVDGELQRKKKTDAEVLLFYSSEKKHLRHVIEKQKAHVVFAIEDNGTKEYTHMRNAGMNQVLAKLLKQKNVAWGISFSSLLNALRQHRVRLFGRIMQNMRLQRKYGFPIMCASFAKTPEEMRATKDLLSLLVTLGADETTAKDALTFFAKK